MSLLSRLRPRAHAGLVPIHLISSQSTVAMSLAPRTVAGSFLFQFPNNDTSQPPLIALFRRSDKVRTYPHKYAPLAGSVEPTDPSPWHTAVREIGEETTLTPPRLQPYRQGKPYSFDEHGMGRRWTINPFAFIVSEDAATQIQLDWEHESYDWFDVESAVRTCEEDGVPNLLRSLRRVWFDIDLGENAGRALRDGLQALRDDHESGARQLASKAVETFIHVVQTLEGREDGEKWWKNLRTAGWHLWKNGRESMGAPILAVVLQCLVIVEHHLSTSTGKTNVAIDRIVKDLRAYAQQRQKDATGISSQLERYLQTRASSSGAAALKILLLSSSSTITACLQHFLSSSPQHALDIRILESRPLFEGVQSAARLRSASSSTGGSSGGNLKITLYTDASAAIAAHDVDLMLLGADLISSSTGAVSNKTGSLPAALAVRYVSPDAKIIVVAEKEKVMPFDAPGHEDNDTREVTRLWGEDVTNGQVGVRNVYFEWVAQTLIDGYVTEDGLVTAREIEKAGEEVKSLAGKFFDSL